MCIYLQVYFLTSVTHIIFAFNKWYSFVVHNYSFKVLFVFATSLIAGMALEWDQTISKVWVLCLKYSTKSVFAGLKIDHQRSTQQGIFSFNFLCIIN